MTPNVNPNSIIWIDPQQRRPLCDIPWLGTTVVLSDGSVNFCCFSSAVVGNVNQQPFEKIWSGSKMQAIRRALSQQRLPPQCQTPSCPIYRGDELHYIFDRMEGPNSHRATGTHDPHAWMRERLQGSELRAASGQTRAAEALGVTLDLCYRGEPASADLFVGVRYPDGIIRFLPGLEPYATPFKAGVELNEDRAPLRFDLIVPRPESHRATFGEYQICAALFEENSNPNLLSNCYWSASRAASLKAEPLWRAR